MKHTLIQAGVDRKAVHLSNRLAPCIFRVPELECLVQTAPDKELLLTLKLTFECHVRPRELVIAANSVQPCWFQFGRQPGRGRVFSEGKPSNAISLAAAIFTGFAAVIYKHENDCRLYLCTDGLVNLYTFLVDFRPPPTNDVVDSAISTPLGEDLNNYITDLATLVTIAPLLCILLEVAFDGSRLDQATERPGGGNTAPQRVNTISLTFKIVPAHTLSGNDLHHGCQGRKTRQNLETAAKPVGLREFAVRFVGGFLEDQNAVKHSSTSKFIGSAGLRPCLRAKRQDFTLKATKHYVAH
jgi:hypothetical protein